MDEYILIDDPRWGPLEKFILDPLHLDDWMWMEAWVKGDRRVEVYKHWQTRMCIHLDERGRLVTGRRLDDWLQNCAAFEIREVGRGRPPWLPSLPDTD
jgi:hypothetical protein